MKRWADAVDPMGRRRQRQGRRGKQGRQRRQGHQGRQRKQRQGNARLPLVQLRLGLAYRFDHYRDDARIDAPDLDGHDHSVTLSATYDFAFGGGVP